MIYLNIYRWQGEEKPFVNVYRSRYRAYVDRQQARGMDFCGTVSLRLRDRPNPAKHDVNAIVNALRQYGVQAGIYDGKLQDVASPGFDPLLPAWVGMVLAAGLVIIGLAVVTILSGGFR